MYPIKFELIEKTSASEIWFEETMGITSILHIDYKYKIGSEQYTTRLSHSFLGSFKNLENKIFLEKIIEDIKSHKQCLRKFCNIRLIFYYLMIDYLKEYEEYNCLWEPVIYNI